MTAPAIGKADTNTTKDSLVTLEYGCGKLWGDGQLQAIAALTVSKTCPIRGQYTELVKDFGARAARIAAAYARFYLEQESGCNTALKGRFYWMGLAAFASKQVKCGLDFIKTASHFSFAAGPLAEAPLWIGKNSLGKGNFWLFQDIYVWHWFYANHPAMFKDCSEERNADDYEKNVISVLRKMPWADEALEIVKNFKVNDYVRAGFKAVEAFEAATDFEAKRAAQFESLLQIANHEQRMVLQPMIYNSVLFRRVLDVQQKMEFVPWLPQRLAAFSTACDVENKDEKVQMTEGDLYDENERMSFITDIAENYHKLMDERLGYMEGQISSISTWAGYV